MANRLLGSNGSPWFTGTMLEARGRPALQASSNVMKNKLNFVPGEAMPQNKIVTRHMELSSSLGELISKPVTSDASSIELVMRCVIRTMRLNMPYAATSSTDVGVALRDGSPN